MLSLKTSVKCYCLVMLWYVSVASGSLDHLNPFLPCFAESWKRWLESVSAVRLRVAVGWLICNVMVVVKKKKNLCSKIAMEQQNASVYNYMVMFIFCREKGAETWVISYCLLCSGLSYLPFSIWNDTYIILVCFLFIVVPVSRSELAG